MSVTIVDYGMGNLRSVQKAFERIGVQAQITHDPKHLRDAERLVLPGVGGFRDAIAELRRLGFVEPIRDFVASGRPFLGICLGLQLLFDVSYEEGEHEGLGIISGQVVRFDLPHEFKVPHMGWNQVTRTRDSELLRDLPNGTHFYFVHSYFVRPADPQVVLLEADYGGAFCAAIQRDSLLATQFHPEKSQEAGSRLLRNFSAWRGESSEG